MGRLTEKEVIRLLIELHQQVILSGGVSHRTWFRSLLSRRQHSLLRIFKLPNTKENLNATISYPCSQTGNSLFEDALCRQPSGFFVHSESSKTKVSVMNITPAKAGSLIDLQVEFVHDSLMKLAAFHQKSR
jgi:hypothetical protein